MIYEAPLRLCFQTIVLFDQKMKRNHFTDKINNPQNCFFKCNSSTTYEVRISAKEWLDRVSVYILPFYEIFAAKSILFLLLDKNCLLQQSFDDRKFLRLFRNGPKYKPNLNHQIC